MPSRPSSRRSSPTPVAKTLDDRHREIVLRLERLKVIAGLLLATPMKESTCVQVRDLIAFFAGPAREHNFHEERFVFPSLLAGSVATMHEIVERLREEHAWIELQWLDIEVQLSALTQGQSSADGQALVAAVDEFVLLMQDHMALEESTIYPQLRGRVHAITP